MFLAATIAAFWLTSNIASAAIESHAKKVYYDLGDADKLFKEYVKEYEKTYNAEEYAKRFEFFKQSLKEINKLNDEHTDSVFGITLFADMSPEEEEAFFGFDTEDIDTENGYFNETVKDKEEESEPEDFIGRLPKNFDWRDKGVVSHVKDQGHCKSCSIFSAIGNIEGQYALKHDKCVSLSEQYCLDCLEDMNCHGHHTYDIMQKLMDKPGIMKEKDYPYTAKDGQDCKEDKSKMVAKVTDVKKINFKGEHELKHKLHKIGPLSISLRLTNKFKHFYGGKGVQTCGKKTMNETKKKHGLHALLLVGYGIDGDDKYWIIKNSWGVKWGNKGYINLARGSNECHIADKHATTAVVK